MAKLSKKLWALLAVVLLWGGVATAANPLAGMSAGHAALTPVLVADDGGYDETKVPALRQKYVDEVGALEGKAAFLKNAGWGEEEIARTLHADRRALGIKYKNLTKPDLLADIYARNEQKYGDKLGPTVEWLRDKGKSWDDIIRSAARTGGKDIDFNKTSQP